MASTIPITLFVILDTISSSFTVTYYADRVVHLGGTASTIGLLVALRALCTALAAPYLGRLSDIYGRRKLALIVSAGTLLTAVLELFSGDLLTYTASRVVFGLTRAALTIANGMVCDLITDPHSRTSAIGRNMTGLGVGFLFGSVGGGMLAVVGFLLPSLVNLVFASLSFLFVLIFIKESNGIKKDSKETSSGKSSNPAEPAETKKQGMLVQAVKSLLAFPLLKELLFYHTAIIFLNTAPQHAYMEYIRIYLKLSSDMRAIFFLVLGVTTAVSQALFASVANSIGVPRFLEITIFLGMLASFFAPLGGTFVFIASALLGTVAGTMGSATLSALSHHSPEHLSGTVSGIHEGLSNLSLAFGGLVCPALSSIHRATPFWLAGLGLLFMLFYKPTLILNPNAEKEEAEEKEKKH